VSQLVQHVAEHLAKSLGTGRAPAAPAAMNTDPSRRSVLLLGVTDDLVERRTQLKDYLEQEGIGDPDLDVSAIIDIDTRELTVQPSVRTDRFPDYCRAVAELALKPPSTRGRDRAHSRCLSIRICSIVISQ